MLLVLRVIMRTVHTVAAAAWVGGSIFYLVALLPALRAGGPVPDVAAKVGGYFRTLVNTSMGVLLLTGVYLTFDRLSSAMLGLTYLVVLVIKIVAALGMFGLAIYQAQESTASLLRAGSRAPVSSSVPKLILALGLLTFALGALLTTVYEAAPAG
jgi:putative copper export protein